MGSTINTPYGNLDRNIPDIADPETDLAVRESLPDEMVESLTGEFSEKLLRADSGEIKTTHGGFVQLFERIGSGSAKRETEQWASDEVCTIDEIGEVLEDMLGVKVTVPDVVPGATDFAIDHDGTRIYRPPLIIHVSDPNEEAAAETGNDGFFERLFSPVKPGHEPANNQQAINFGRKLVEIRENAGLTKEDLPITFRRPDATVLPDSELTLEQEAIIKTLNEAGYTANFGLEGYLNDAGAGQLQLASDDLSSLEGSRFLQALYEDREIVEAAVKANVNHGNRMPLAPGYEEGALPAFRRCHEHYMAEYNKRHGGFVPGQDDVSGSILTVTETDAATPKASGGMITVGVRGSMPVNAGAGHPTP